MKNTAFKIFGSFTYWLLKEDQYALQSPFIYQLYRNLLEFKAVQTSKTRNELANLELNKKEKGDSSMSETTNTTKKKGQIRTQHIKKKEAGNLDKYAFLCSYFCKLTPAKTIVSWGSTVALHAKYLSAKTNETVFAFDDEGENIDLHLEQSKEISSPSSTRQKLRNLSHILKDINSIDFLLLGDIKEGKTTSTDLLNEVKGKINAKSIVAIRGIHKTKKNKKIWDEFESQSHVKLSLDFYEFGIIFFESPFPKKKYILEY